MELRRGILTGSASVGALIFGGLTQNFRRYRSDKYAGEDFSRIYTDRSSIVIADDGLPLAVREVGPASAPLTVIFVHGFCLRLSSWHFQRTLLEPVWGAEVRMIFYDHRGHGESGMPTAESCTIAQLGADLGAIMRTLAPTGPIVLVGHSLGGMSIIALANRQKEFFSNRVVGVALLGTAAADLTNSGLGRGLANPLVDAFVASGRQLPQAFSLGRAAIKQLLDPILGQGSFDINFSSPTIRAFAAKMIRQTEISTIVNFLKSLELHDESAGLATISALPSLVMVGYGDKVTPLERSVHIHQELANSQLVGLADSGHLLILEAPEKVSMEIEKLVSRVRKNSDG